MTSPFSSYSGTDVKQGLNEKLAFGFPAAAAGPTANDRKRADAARASAIFLNTGLPPSPGPRTRRGERSDAARSRIEVWCRHDGSGAITHRALGPRRDDLREV